MIRQFRRTACTAFAAFTLAAAAHARTDGVLTLGLSQFPPELHPFAISSGAKTTALGALRRGLWAIDPQGVLACRLCERTPAVADGSIALQADGTEQVTLTLRPGLAWADGAPLTTADLLRGLAEARIFAGADAAADAVDARTIRYRLPRPTSDLARAIPDPFPMGIDADAPGDALGRLRQSTYSRAPETPGLWNGPYRLAEFRRNDRITLVPNEHWTGPAPAFAHVELRLIENTAALQSNLLSGDIDLPSAEVGLSFDQSLALARDHGDRFDVTFTPGEGIELIVLRLDNPLLADARVRRAVLLAIDRATMSKK